MFTLHSNAKGVVIVAFFQFLSVVTTICGSRDALKYKCQKASRRPRAAVDNIERGRTTTSCFIAAIQLQRYISPSTNACRFSISINIFKASLTLLAAVIPKSPSNSVLHGQRFIIHSIVKIIMALDP